MRLLLDVGNTAVKWGCFAAGALAPTGGFGYRDGRIDALADAAWQALPAPEAVYIASVGTAQTGAALAAWFAARWQVQVVFLHSAATACGVSNGYPVPEDLGIDRWAAVIAAHHGYPGTVCVVDCGTAITLDLVTAGGEHCGGLILPGIDVMQQALLRETAGLRAPAARPVASPLADNTAAGIEGGAVYLLAAGIERIVADMRRECDTEITMVLTGGAAGRLLPVLPGGVSHDPDLVLRGVAMLAGEQG